MKKWVNFLFIVPASALVITPAVVLPIKFCCSPQHIDPIKDIIPEDKLVIKNGVLSGFVEGFDATQYNRLVIPNSVHTVSANAFATAFVGTECKMTSIVIPPSVVTIETKAFYGNDAVVKYDLSNFISTKNVNFASDAFAKSASKGTIIYNENCSDSLQNSIDYLMCDAGLELGWFDTNKVRDVERRFLDINENENILSGFTENFNDVPHTALFNKLVIPYEITSIAKNAFYRNNQTTLKSIKDVHFQTDPETELTHVQNIGPWAFRASNLETIVLKPGTTTIYVGAFQECVKLKNLTLPNTLVTIKAKAFYKCTSLTSITIPETVTTIEGDEIEYKSEETKLGAFAGCNNITNINLLGIYKTPPLWEKYAFYGLDKSKTGNIICEPCLAPKWKIYFGDIGMVFTNKTWTITDKINILNGYTPLVNPYPIRCQENIQAIETIYFSQIENQPQILIDDLYHTFYHWTKVANQKNITLEVFDALIKSVSANFEDKSISFNFHYRVKGKFENNSFDATGNMNFRNLPLVVTTASNSAESEPTKFIELLSDDVSKNDFWVLKFEETHTINSEQEVIVSPQKTIRNDNINEYKDMGINKVGVFWKLNLFLEPKDDGQTTSWYWGIVSPFLQNIKVINS